MGWSRSARIKTLLAIDTVFLFIELITGYAVGSLALVADSFHMLNDVMSLIVALYALKLAENSTRSNKYSYGWQRAEILGALINGVFLLALCFSIFLEALQRMFEAPEVRSPKLVVIVGSLGLLSNIVGLFLFHEHGHSHGGGGGGGGHSHGHSHAHDKKAEEGHSHSVKSKSSKKGQNGLITIGTSARNGAGANGTPDERSPLLAGGSSSREADFPALPTAAASSHGNVNATASRSVAIGGAETPFADGDDDEYDDDDDGDMRNELDGIEELLVHPARTREAIVRQAYDAGFGSPRNSNDAGFGGHRRSISLQSAGAAMSGKRGRTRAESVSKKTGNRERSASRSSAHGANHGEHGHAGHPEHPHSHEAGHEHGDDHEHHDHAHDHGDSDVDEEDGHDHGHSHGGHSHDNMNMRGVFLHVMGDALGNVGVIAAGLIIWLTKSPYRFYSDPVISFIITIIIFSSALPLVRSASFILLQGTPSHVPLEKVRSAILKIPNVISVHDLHIWSLSESKLVASMHILVKSHNEFAPCSREVRKVLHRFGVHSTTIQPELLDVESATGQAAVGMIMSRQGSSEMLANGAGAEDDGVGCMAQCDDSCVDNSCCPPVTNQAIAAALSSKSNQSLRAGSNGNNSASGSKANGNLGGASYASVASSHNH